MTYEYRIVQRRARWAMGNPYDEWFQPLARDFGSSDDAVQAFETLRAERPDEDIKLQWRRKVQEWRDLTA
jgi:hypothetical protein